MDTKRKQIRFTNDGVDYTLEYTPWSIRQMERDGFDFTNMEKHIVNVPYDLFSGAFIAHHNYVPIKEREKLYSLLVNENEQGQNLLQCLSEMLKDEMEFIVNKPGGNVSWVMV